MNQGKAAQTLQVLIDFDNISAFFRLQRSLHALYSHLLTKIPNGFFPPFGRIDFRLYGGWDDRNRLTRQAQVLSAEIQVAFPAALSVILANGGKHSLVATTQLAAGPLAIPTEILRRTWMRDRSARKIRTADRPWNGCASQGSCAMSMLESILTRRSCPNEACELGIDSVLKRDEQKQVDTLIVADMLYLTFQSSASHIVVVSSDADMWPGILVALSAGAHVCHVHTESGRRTPPYLAGNLSRLSHLYSEAAV